TKGCQGSMFPGAMGLLFRPTTPALSAATISKMAVKPAAPPRLTAVSPFRGQERDRLSRRCAGQHPQDRPWATRSSFASLPAQGGEGQSGGLTLGAKGAWADTRGASRLASGLDALALSHHSGARARGAGGPENPFCLFRLSLFGIIS